MARKFRRLRAVFVLDFPCKKIGNQFYARKKIGKDREEKKREGEEAKGIEGRGRREKKNGRME